MEQKFYPVNRRTKQARARAKPRMLNGGAGPWTGQVEATVMDEESLPPTDVVVPLTNTAIPPTITAPDVGPRELEFVVLNGDPNDAFDVSWPVPSDYPVDYRINWAVESGDYPTWTDLSANAFPVTNAYTITGLAVDVCYKVRVRAPYGGSAGDWIEAQGKINGSC